MKNLGVLMMLCLFLMTSATNESGLQIRITQIRNAQGVIQLGVFTDQKSFEAEKPLFRKVVSKKGMKGGTLITSFPSIPKGRYGIALLDDENENGEMDYRFFVPLEGYGFSNFEHAGLRKPSFDDFAFSYDGKGAVIPIKVCYFKK
jgi:uncharacterized protein (DUF2141 family)